jgi:hypothetical protein
VPTNIPRNRAVTTSLNNNAIKIAINGGKIESHKGIGLICFE